MGRFTGTTAIAALAANDWFNNQAGVGRPKLDLNQGGRGAGRTHHPRQAVFLWNYEGYPHQTAGDQLDTTLTGTAKQGIFQYKTAAAPCIRSIF